MIEEVGTLGNYPLPSMLRLYESDVRKHPNSHLDLPIKIAYSICCRYPGYHSYLMDFIQEGNLELLRCVEVFNKEHSERTNDEFRSYAAACIRGVIYHYFSRIPDIYIPSASRQVFFTQKGRDDELDILEHCISFEALYEHMLEIEEPTNMQVALYDAKSEQVHTLLSTLPTRERQAMMMRYGIDGPVYGFEEIAQEMRVVTKHVYHTIRLATRRLNGSYTSPSRELVSQENTRKRTERLHEIYDQHRGKINRENLARLAHCSTNAAQQFLREQRGKQ